MKNLGLYCLLSLIYLISYFKLSTEARKVVVHRVSNEDGVEIFSDGSSTYRMPTISTDGNLTDITTSRRLQQQGEHIAMLYPLNPALTMFIDPPDGAMRPTAVGVFVRASSPTAVVYYSFEGSLLTTESAMATYTSPYIHIDTPYGYGRDRFLNLVAVDKGFRSANMTLHYIVEASARPNSFMFISPSLETNSFLLKVGIEMKATARAQTAGGQEFADFFTNLGAGTYATQVANMHMPSLDPDLTAFEGGVPINCSNDKHYGVFFPYHNGKKFFGKVVRIDLGHWQNTTAHNHTDNTCFYNWRMEAYDANKTSIIVTGQSYDGATHTFFNTTPSREDACVFILDLSTVHQYARGFRRGFVGYPYVYLSPGEFNVPVRINVEKFAIENVEYLDLGLVDETLGGYSAGFTDGAWSCFTPFRTYYGPVGGLRSKLAVDVHQLRTYYHGRLLCIHEDAYLTYQQQTTIERNASVLHGLIRILDTSNMLPELRGFSDSIRVGRYAYLAPFSSDNHVYTGKLVRIDLGNIDIGNVVDRLAVSGAPVSSVLRVIDLSMVSKSYLGFSSIFQAGMYLFLVPFRNSYEPANGQRGHGHIVRLNMNQYSISGIDGLDLGKILRTQVPSFPDTDLRGFIQGFASGQYAVLVPFFNAIFSGKFARFLAFPPGVHFNQSMVPADLDLQELDTTTDRLLPGTYRGYRGGFPSYWNGVDATYTVN